MTVPAEIRRELDLKEGDRVTFLFDHGEVRLARSGSVVAQTMGALARYSRRPATAEELREAAEQAFADESGA